MPFTVIEIYFLIGLSHWASHVLACGSCHKALFQSIVNLTVFCLEGLTHLFGWPLTFASFLIVWFRKEEKEETSS